MRRLKSTITVFLALIFVCISALVLTLVESARTAGLRYHLESSADSAIDSLFSEYHNELWDRYRLLAYDCPDTNAAMNSVTKYMQPYLEVKSWMRMDAAAAQLNQVSYLTDNGGEWLEDDAVDYMTFGIAENLFDLDTPDTLNSLWDELKESKAMQEITRDYAEESKKAIEVEEALVDIDESLKSQQNKKSSAVSALRSGSNGSFQSTADSMIREMERLTGRGGSSGDGLVCNYENASYELAVQLDEVDAQNAGLYENIVSADGMDIVNSVKNDYADYSNQESSRRAEIEDIYAQTLRNIESVRDAQDTADMIEELEDEIADIEDPEERSAYRAEIRDLWEDLADSFDAMTVPGLNCEFGVENEQEKGFLESAKELLSGDLLSLVLPEGTTASTTELDLSEAPSKTSMTTGRTTPYASVVERALLMEYIGRYFTEFTDPRTGAAAYEMEYICAGLGNDKQNLSAALGDVFAIREGMNYLAIMRDDTKRSTARTLAQEIVLGASGGTLAALVPVIECLIIGVWAGAESVIDLRTLLSGNKVSIMKSNEEWKLDVRSILDWGQSRHLGGSVRSDERGVDYENYLKFVILLVDGALRNYRMMDIIQMNLKVNDPGFRMRDCIYGMDITVTAQAAHLFTSVPLISGETSPLARGFTLRTNAAKAY